MFRWQESEGFVLRALVCGIQKGKDAVWDSTKWVGMQCVGVHQR